MIYTEYLQWVLHLAVLVHYTIKLGELSAIAIPNLKGRNAALTKGKQFSQDHRARRDQLLYLSSKPLVSTIPHDALFRTFWVCEIL